MIMIPIDHAACTKGICPDVFFRSRFLFYKQFHASVDGVLQFISILRFHKHLRFYQVIEFP